MLRSLIFVVALASGGSAAYLMKQVETRADQTAQLPAPAVVFTKVLVAQTHVKAGKSFTEEDLAWVDWPETGLTAEFVAETTNPDALETTIGNIARQELFPGQPVLAQSFAQTREGYLASLLSPGMRAVAIQVSAAKTAGGFILPNNNVDVLMTSSCDGSLSCKTAMQTQTILQNVRVLAIDQSGTNPNNENNVLIGKTATLELSPEDAEQIIAAEASGALSLLLRSSDDTEIVQLSRLEPEQIEVPKAPRTIKVNRGIVREIVELKATPDITIKN